MYIFLLLSSALLALATTPAEAQQDHPLTRTPHAFFGREIDADLLWSEQGVHAGMAEPAYAAPLTLEGAAARRSAPRHILIGALSGAVIGTAAGLYVMYRAEDWLAPPAPFLTAPAGAVLGAGVGTLLYVLRR